MIWKEINAYPSPTETLLKPEERQLPPDDTSFVSKINENFIKNFDVSPDLLPKDRYLVQRYLEENRDIYAFEDDPLGRVTVWRHKIPTGDHPPIRSNPYRFSEIQKAEVEKQVTKMLRQGVIVPAVTSWSSPITLAPKRDGTWRFCVDYRKLNDITQKDSFPVPRLDEALSIMRGCNRFTVQDAQTCFWQIPMSANDQEKTTFVCHLGTFMFRVMPFGLTGAPASCSRTMSRIFMNLERRIGFIYMDDLICFSDGTEEHVRRLMILAERCRKYGLKMRADKCAFAYPSVAYLGHPISGEGISPDLDRHKDIFDKPKPTNIKTLQSFLGFINFFRGFIVNFAEKAAPLTRLLRKKVDWKWSEEQDKAYDQLLRELTYPPILAHYDPEAELELRVDASDEGLGCVVVQINKQGKRQLLAAYSRTYQPYEESYGVTHKECLGILFGIRQARPFVFGRFFTIVTDHCGLCYLMRAKDLNSRLARWSLELATYNFKIVYNSGKAHGDADYMSRHIRKCQTHDTQLNSLELEEIKCLAFGLNPSKQLTNQLGEEWSPADTKQAQRNDEVLGPIAQELLQPLVNNTEPPKSAEKFELRNELLFRKYMAEGQQMFRLAIPKALIRDVLYYCHDLPTSGHFGYIKTLWRVKQYAWWQYMNIDVANYVKSCRACQFRKSPNTRPLGPQLKITPIVNNVMKSVSIDLVGPLSQTKNDNRHILTITDQLSKFAIAIPLYETKDVDIIEALEQGLIYRYGPPKVLLSDNGKNLCSRNCEKFYEHWGITHITTTPYHPQSNGSVEKFNGTIAILLATQIKNEDETWDEFIDEAVLSYNTTISESTGFSPFYLMFGKQIDQIPMLRIGCESAENHQGSDLIADRKLALDRIKKMQQRNMMYANKNRPVSQLKVDDKVLLQSAPLMQQRSAKLHYHYTGPFRVVRCLSGNVCKIQSIEGRLKTKVVNVMLLKRYYAREDFALRCEQA